MILCVLVGSRENVRKPRHCDIIVDDCGDGVEGGCVLCV